MNTPPKDKSDRPATWDRKDYLDIPRMMEEAMSQYAPRLIDKDVANPVVPDNGPDVKR
jgi:hypothetical protein